MSDEPRFGTTEESCTLASSEPKAESSTALFFFERTEDTWIKAETGLGVRLGSRTDLELKWGIWRDCEELWG